MPAAQVWMIENQPGHGDPSMGRLTAMEEHPKELLLASLVMAIVLVTWIVLRRTLY
jgi:hypothetical protein